MDNDPLSKYGPCLTGREYDEGISELYKRAAESLSSMSPEAAERTLKAEEFDLAIDHGLGVNFPREKRDALRNAQQRVEKQRLRLVGRFLKNSILKRELADGTQVLLERMMEEFSKILTDEELRAFMRLKQGETPKLSIDLDRIGEDPM